MYQRMLTVRSAACFVFRHHPEIVREFTSAYARRKRRAPGKGAGPGAPVATPAPFTESVPVE